MTTFLDNLVLFSRALRAAGIKVSLDQTLSLARALDWIDLGDRDQVFHAARSFLVSRKEDLALFEKVFERFWLGLAEDSGPQVAPPAPRHDLRRKSRFSVSYLAARARETDPAIDVADRSDTYSPDEVLRRRDFAKLSDEELEQVRRLIRDTRWRTSQRTTRRRVPDRRGSTLDLRRVLRDAAKFGGAPLKLHHLKRKVKQRPMILLADISGSMEKYSRLMLQFFFSAVQSLGEVECFVFGTRLTRVTHQLRLRNIDRALEEAAREILDWSGGTRIGDSLASFNRRWSRRLLRRGAVVIIVSDGWERGDLATLAREMRFLQHRCYRLIWLNPHLGQAGYEPRVGGMATALPFVDDFLTVHNLSSLRTLARKLAELPPRGAAPAPRRPPAYPSSPG